jgi:hypothetical protein
VTFGTSIRIEVERKGFRNYHVVSTQSELHNESVFNPPYWTFARYGGSPKGLTAQYYYAVEPFLKSLTRQDEDGILVILIPGLRHALNTYPTRSETTEIESASLSYFFFDIKTKELIFTNSAGGLRDSKRSGPPMPMGPYTSIITFGFTESTTAFLNRVVEELFDDLPAAR